MNGNGSPPTLRDRLQALAAEAGGTYTIDQHELDARVTIHVPGRGEVSLTVEADDDENVAVQFLRTRLVNAGLLETAKHRFTLSYPGGRRLTIWAVDEQQAIRLAAQGQPEEIEVAPA